jgi:hypothetical protein
MFFRCQLEGIVRNGDATELSPSIPSTYPTETLIFQLSEDFVFHSTG